MKKPSKKKNPQDLTHRNLRALKKRIKDLEDRCDVYQAAIDGLYELMKPRKRK